MIAPGRAARLFTVFLSSPGDVPEERAQALAVLSGIQRKERFLHQGVTLTPVAWDDPAEPTPPEFTQPPQPTVNDYKLPPSCCDLTVVILWSRLGSLLSSVHLAKPDGSTYASGTEWEIADARQAGKPIFAYASQKPLPRKRSSDDKRQTEALDAFLERELRNPDGSYRASVQEFDGIEQFRRLLELNIEQWLDKQLRALDVGRAGGESLSFFLPDIKPSLPEKWVTRPEVDALRATLLGGSEDARVVVTGTGTEAGAAPGREIAPGAIRVALRGGGGLGKTSIAVAICHDPRVREHFRDGILWITFGQTPDIPTLLHQQLQRLTRSPVQCDELEATSRYRELVRERKLLVVLDDVWNERHARPFLAPSRGAVLLTTRIASLPAATGASDFAIDRMAPDTATALVLQWVPEAQRHQDFALVPLVRKLGGWPLLLTLVGAFLGQQVRLGRTLRSAVDQALGRLAAFGPSGFDDTEEGDVSKARERSVEACLMLCFEFEGPVLTRKAGQGGLRARFEELGVFAEGAAIPHATIARFWQTAGVEPLVAEELLHKLHDWAMFDRFELSADGGCLRLHDVVRAVLQHRRQAEQAELHERLLASFGVDLYELPRADAYMAEHVALHVREARGPAALRALLFDPQFMKTKLETRGIDGLLADFRTLGVRDRRLGRGAKSLQATDAAATLLFEALQLSASALRERPEELAFQLLARLPERDEGFVRLRERLVEVLKGAWLHPIRLSLTHAGGALLASLFGHTDSVEGALLLQGGERALSWSRDGTLALWDLQQLKCVHSLDGHTDWVAGALLLEGGERALSWSADATLKLWDLLQGRCVRSLDGHSTWVTGALLLEGGDRALSWSLDTTLKLWELHQGKCVHSLDAHTRSVNGALLLEGGERALSWSLDGTLRLWDLQHGKCVRSLDGHTGSVNGALLLEGGDRVLSWSADTLTIWDLEQGKCIKVLDGHTSAVGGALLLEGGGRALSWSFDGPLKLWDLRHGKILRSLDCHSAVTGALPLGRGDRALSWSVDGTLKLWDLQHGECIQSLDGHTAWVTGALLLEGCDRALSWCEDKSLKLWDLEHGTCVNSLDGHTGSVAGALLLEGGDRALSWSADTTLKLWDLQQGKSVHFLEGHSARVAGAVLLECGDRALSWSHDTTLKLWDSQRGKCVCSLDGHTAWVTGAVLLERGDHALSWSVDTTLKLWDLQRGKCVRSFEGHTARVAGVVPFERGDCALSWSADTTLKLWDLQHGKCLHSLDQHTAWVSGALLLESGDRALSWSYDATLKLWDLQHGKCVHSLDGHTDPVNGALLLEGGDRALSWSSDMTLKLWDLRHGKCVCSLDGHTGSVLGVLLLEGGDCALSWSADMTLKLWDLRQGRCVASLEGHRGWIYGVLLLEGGHRALSRSSDGTLKLWDLRQGTCTCSIDGHAHRVIGALLLDDGERALSWSEDRTLRLWDLLRSVCLETVTFDAPLTVCCAAGHRLFLGDAAGGVHFLEFRRTLRTSAH